MKTASILLILVLLNFSGWAIAQTSRQVYTPFHVSILLAAQQFEGFGSLPHLDFNFSKIPFIPAFTQNPNDKQRVEIKGLVKNSTRDELFKLFDTLEPTPLSLPFKAMIVGLRIDPCSNGTFSEVAKCVPELRLVGEDADLEDRSIHLIYSLSQENLSNILQDIVQLNSSCESLRQNSDTLSVHPCSKNLLFVRNFNSIVFKYAIDHNLKKMAFQIRTTDNDSFASWIFSAAQKDSTGRFHLVRTISAPTGEEFFAFKETAFFDTEDGAILNKTDELVLEGHNRKLADDKVGELIKQLEEPRTHSVNNTSCFSCHSTEALRNRFVHSNDRHDLRTDEIRHFGYMFGKPKISHRVKKETQIIINYLNSVN